MYRFQAIGKNQKLKETLLRAMEIRRLIRTWFQDQGFLEVETSALTKTPGQEPYLSPFETTVFDECGRPAPAFLITSPEYALKKLLVAGFPKVFELARVFRNHEPRNSLHNPEFTMLEWYRAGTDYRGIMDDVEDLVCTVAKKLRVTSYELPVTILNQPWERLSVREAFERYAGIELENRFGRPDFDDWFFKVFLTHIEQKLGQVRPTILYDYPASMAALARLKSGDPRYAERFEVYIKGVELANAFSELGDAQEQRARFVEEQNVRRVAGRPAHPIDEEFLAALEHGLPECGGIALGVDRLAMALLDAKGIDEVLFFPYLFDLYGNNERYQKRYCRKV